MSGDYLAMLMMGAPKIRREDLRQFMNADEFHTALEKLEEE